MKSWNSKSHLSNSITEVKVALAKYVTDSAKEKFKEEEDKCKNQTIAEATTRQEA